MKNQEVIIKKEIGQLEERLSAERRAAQSYPVIDYGGASVRADQEYQEEKRSVVQLLQIIGGENYVRECLFWSEKRRRCLEKIKN